jgi:glycosyltransferase involved in cell wall biosynthesis
MTDRHALHGVLVTYRRPESLAITLKQLSQQSRRLDTLVVVDNAGDPETRRALAANPSVATDVEYLASPENLGPAGGLALGSRQVIGRAADADWVMFLDDDNPPRTLEMFSELTAFGEEIRQQDPQMGGVGLIGSRFNVRTGLGVRLADDELHGPVRVDYVGGGQLPCFSVEAMREVGLPDPRLFFGFDDLEYGLRLRFAGRPLYVSGEFLHRERGVYGILGQRKPPNRTITTLGWRDYYSTRNLVWILRHNRRHMAAVRVVMRRVVAKAAYNVTRDPTTAWTHVALGTRATFDAYTGRMGRTIEPGAGSAAA